MNRLADLAMREGEMTALQRFDITVCRRTAALRAGQRGGPYDAALVASRITGLLAGRVVPFKRPARPAAPAPAPDVAELLAGVGLAAEAESRAARTARAAALEEERDDLRAEVRGLRSTLAEAEAERARAIDEAVRRTRRELLGEARLTVAGHTMPSIAGGAS